MGGVVKKRKVFVIGAGVAGLTAAHELAERGFKVYVFDSARDIRRPDKPAIGGMARTQWARVPVERDIGGSGAFGTTESESILIPALDPPIFQDLAQEQSRLPDSQQSPWPELYFSARSADLGEEPDAKDVGKPEDRLESVIVPDMVDYLHSVAAIVRKCDALARWCTVQDADATPADDRGHAIDDIFLDGTYSTDEDVDEHPANGRRLDWQRVREVATCLCARLEKDLRAHEMADGTWKAVVPSGDDLAAPTLITYRRADESGETKTYLIARVMRAGVGDVYAGDRVRQRWQQRYVRISLRSKLLPGEHGYRLFPRFYKNLLDTMTRTPILAARSMTPDEFAESRRRRDPSGMSQDDQVWEPTGRSVFDNLIPVTEHDFAGTADNKPRRLPRFRGDAIGDLLDVVDLLQKDMGWSNRDLMLAQLKFLQYATSSKARRETYEKISWGEFIGLDTEGRFSERFKEAMGRWPQALIGLRADDIDARTFGSTALQQVIDQLKPIGYRDGTLNNPTTTAWFDHWQRYLESLGVEFCRGTLKELKLHTSDGKIWVVPVFEESAAMPRESVGDPPKPPRKIEAVYIVMALPVEKSWEFAGQLERSIADLGQAPHRHGFLREHKDSMADQWKRGDFAAVRGMLDQRGTTSARARFSAKRLSESEPHWPLQNFAGIQFFCDEDYRFTAGHVYYPNSAWGLTSISQSRFRQDQAASRYKYRGVMSVIIGVWNAPGTETTKKTAWRCDDQELARECWAQMEAGYGDQKPAPPRWFHVDRNVPFSRHHKHRSNASPYLTTAPGAFARWPGTVGDYRLQFGNVVLAGSYMKTHTRLVTMEAANESGRHAANAVLHDWVSTREHGPFIGRSGPEIWDPEEWEIRDLGYLKSIDERLFEEGLPHAFEILGLDAMIAVGDDGEGHPATLTEALNRVGMSQGRAIATLIERLRGLY